jgi:hypothetical protein
MPDIGLDTGYRAPDWDEREDCEKRLDYHHIAIGIGAAEMRDELWRTVHAMHDPEHTCDHIRNALALLLRNVCFINFRMNSEQMKAFICGLADQAYREDRIRIFHASSRSQGSHP